MKLIENKIEKFGQLISKIGAGLEAAGALLVEMLAEDTDAKKKILKAYPEISIPMLNQLEAVGRKQMHPRLALTDNAGFKRMRNLPYSDQERYLTEPLKLVVDHDGEYDVLLVNSADLTPDQARQMFAAEHVRSEGAQRAYLEDLKQKEQLARRTQEITEPYKVHMREGTVEFRAGVRMTRRELAQLIAKLS